MEKVDEPQLAESDFFDTGIYASHATQSQAVSELGRKFSDFVLRFSLSSGSGKEKDSNYSARHKRRAAGR